VLLEVMLLEHSSMGVNHSSSSTFNLPFSDRLRMAFEKSLASGEPFWNICIEREKENNFITFCRKGGDKEVEESVATYKAQSSKSGGGSGANEAVAVLIEENFLVWELKKGSRYNVAFKCSCVIVFAGDVQYVVCLEAQHIV
jgi:hypothetical protein